MLQSLILAICASGAPLSMLDHPSWKAFFQELRPSFDLPNSAQILDGVYTNIKAQFQAQLKHAENLHLQCDGWSSAKNEGVINLVISKPEPVFVKFLKTNGNKCCSKYLRDKIIRVIESSGPEKFFVIVGDNTKSMQNAFNLVREEYPHIVPLRCVAHTLHLMSDDVLSLPLAKQITKDVLQIQKVIKQSQVLAALHDSINKKKGCSTRLKVSCECNSESYMYSLKSMIANKDSLQTLAVHKDAAGLLKDIKGRLLDNTEFWSRIEWLRQVLEPIIKWLTLYKSKKTFIHTVYYALNETEKELEAKLRSSDLITEDERIDLCEKIKDRGRSIVSSIHMAAQLLDPKSKDSNLSQQEDFDAKKFIYEVAKSMDLDLIKVTLDMDCYKTKFGLWKNDDLWQQADNMDPIDWWKEHCGSSVLSKVAVRILSAPVTSAPLSYISTKARNKLSSKTEAKVIYLANNWKLFIGKRTMNTESKDPKRILDIEDSTTSGSN